MDSQSSNDTEKSAEGCLNDKFAEKVEYNVLFLCYFFCADNDF